MVVCVKFVYSLPSNRMRTNRIDAHNHHQSAKTMPTRTGMFFLKMKHLSQSTRVRHRTNFKLFSKYLWETTRSILNRSSEYASVIPCWWQRNSSSSYLTKKGRHRTKAERRAHE